MKDTLHLLKTKRFLPLFITQFMGAFNDNAFKNAFLIWFTYDIAKQTGADANFVVTLAAGLFILPFFLFSATAGQVADKYEKSLLTQKIKQVEIILMIGCAFFFYLKSVEGLMVILFFMGVQSTFFGPIKYSLLPEHLKEDELISGNGLIEGGTFLSILLGTIFGGLIIRTTYGVGLLSAFVILFAVIGWFSSRYIPTAKIGDKNLKVSWNIIAQTWKIIGYARQERTVWLSIIGISWFWFVGVTFLTQFPIYTKNIIGGNEHVVTLFLAVFSIGVGIGSVLCNKLLKGQINGRLVPMGAAGMTVSIFLFAYASGLYTNLSTEISIMEFLSSGIPAWLIIIDLLMLSVFSGIYIVPLYTIMQHRSDNKHISRIIAANNVINAFFMVIASIYAILIFEQGFNVVELLLSVGLLNIPVFFMVRRIVKRRLGNEAS
ncbi:MAG: MFS transporter [Alphaproteobacteria bacterium CG11_big_fil_rev_8_21_14_0_20_39_49]|nr:MAG: MFS transporter [Alphaproteobacteria bacterium CG11_big_fil_rev_8_21_14_0_20_39_49]